MKPQSKTKKMTGNLRAACGRAKRMKANRKKTFLAFKSRNLKKIIKFEIKFEKNIV